MKLPVGYKELEYIRSTGTQYLKLGFSPAALMTFEVDINVRSVSGFSAIFGSRNKASTSATLANMLACSTATAIRRDYYGISKTYAVDTSTGRRKFKAEQNVLYINGERALEHDISNSESELELFLLAANNVGSANYYINGDLYSFSARTPVLEVRNLVPCQNPDGEIGVYDLVEGIFIGHSGADPFIAGPEITYPPGKPMALNVSLDGQTIILSWNGAENPESYNIYRNGEFVGSSEIDSYVDSDVPYGTYIYEVSTVNRYGESERISTSVTISEPAVDNTSVKKETLVYLLDRNYQPYDVIDVFRSLIWAVRYTKCGDFELYIPATSEMISRFHEGDYAMLEESDRLMIIEDINLQTDSEEGDYLIISGRSLESILERRIIWGMTVLTGNFQNGIRTLLNRNVINPSIPQRRIPNFVFKESNDPRITELTIDAQYFGENLYKEIEKLCVEKNIGFRVLPTSNGGFEFSLYVGVDRSYAQDSVPWVVFAPNYENLRSSNYLYSKKEFRNVALVGGMGEGWFKETSNVDPNNVSGLVRREMYVDASSLTYDTTGIENDPDLTEEEKQDLIDAMKGKYLGQLRQKGLEELSKTKITESFDGEIDASVQYIYGRDFDIGDIVQIENEYGMTSSSQISEVVISQDLSGISVVPTFTKNEAQEGE